MSIKTSAGIERISGRSDLSSHLIHLARGVGPAGKSPDAVDVLLKILREGKINGSTTSTGFIVGKTPAVCFQDVPLTGLVQNIRLEAQLRKKNPNAKKRYDGVGLLFSKTYVYRRGGRPVFYEQTNIAKGLLPKGEHWRIVNLNLRVDDDLIDWTHEREWRVPTEFEFALSKATVLLPSSKEYDVFAERCKTEENKQIRNGIKEVVLLDSILI